MPDFDRLLNQQRNVVLGPQRTTGDIIRAGIQSTTGSPYGENLSNIEADKYNRALSQYGVLSNERDFQTQKDQQMWDRAQAEADRGDKTFQTLLQLSSAYGSTPAESQRLASTVIQRTEAEDLQDPSALPTLVAEEAQRLGLPEKTGATDQIVGPGSTFGKVDPITGQFDPQYVGPTAPSGGVTIVNQQERQLERDLGGLLAEAKGKSMEMLTRSDSMEASSRTLRSVLERAETGTLRPTIGALSGFAEDLGVDLTAVAGRLGLNLDSATDAQTIARVSADLILDKLSDLPDARPSDRDLAMIERASSGLIKTREENLRYLDALDNTTARMREWARLAQDSDTWEDYETNVREWREANPITTFTGPRNIIMPDKRTGYYDDDLGWYRYDDTNAEMSRE